MSERFDIVIAGGGLVGSSLAIALEGSGWRVALVESAAPRVDLQPSYDERNLALARASINALASLGVWPLAEAQAAPIRHVHVSRRGDFGAIRLDAEALGLPAFGAVLPARELGNALLRRLEQCDRLARFAPATLVAVVPGEDHLAIELDAGGDRHRLTTRLLVGADGTASFVRRDAGIGTRETDYRQSAIVTTVTTERPLDGRAYERFTESGPVALLPMPGRRAGLVVSVPQAEAERVAALDDAAFLALVHARLGYRAGRLDRPGRRVPYPLRRLLADALTAPRRVLVGNAAQTVHPLGAQGFNLGLRDALTLAEVLGGAADGGDPGSATRLARHVERRRDDREATTAFSDDLVRVMGNDFLPLRLLRSAAFGVVDRLPPLKRQLALRGMGYRGDVPARTLSP
ncbi:2-octaprenyl-6-methoxyphenyl hydroxylase [Dokdonella koreensis]|uniref:2-octaprenyl-6-methoxyphenol hydroxylase n=1 Tax=Dokdonella koreensis DS-123 TaxID=1300342 RepID=A0A160DUK6_9GAMM|nr:2-octaprenyl-6-methoxyphenyl hydroxylase [Dokdonella koreensis]ANB18167.1 2-octaprenyl-6-methoxyphenol hydroxylase [Dokdonella koreensis DS-123]